jgi:hypothetical protein
MTRPILPTVIIRAGDPQKRPSNPSILPLCFSHLVQPFQRAQTQGQSLRSASYADESGHGSIVAFLLNAKIGKSILPYCQLVSVMSIALC